MEVGAAAPPVDVSTTGSASGYVPQPVTAAPIDWSQNPYVQLEGGFLGGLLLGLVPFAGVGHELLDGAGALPHGTPQARLGLAVGQIVGGIALTMGGLTGEVLGGITSATGIGAAIGVPAMVASTGLVVGGVGNIAAGIQGLSQALMSSGSGSTGPKGPASGTGGPLLAPYGGPGGGHHVPAKAAFKGDPGYDPNRALAIPNAELVRLGVRHRVVTTAQAHGYRALARSGAPLTWESVAAIETNALIQGGMAPEAAQLTVRQAIAALQKAGIAGPTRIPWGP